jgi:type VI protein secretion system component VasK
MFEIPSFDDLSSLFQSCSSDLRQTLLILQFLAQSSVVNNLSKHPSEENNSLISTPKFQSSRIFDAMYYSYLNEQWNESMLKIYFDDLTRKYTSEYNQAHHLLLNSNKYNPTR